MEYNNNLLYKKYYGNDNILYKEIIKKKLINNVELLKALDNPELDPEEESDSYIGDNIRPYYMILPETQTNSKNYLCFETAFSDVVNENRIMKYGQIMFYILCNVKNIYDKETGISRHDLISALIQDDFNWCADFGNQLKLISDRPYAADNNYVLRTLTFEQTSLNGITNAKTQNIVTDKDYSEIGRTSTNETKLQLLSEQYKNNQ